MSTQRVGFWPQDTEGNLINTSSWSNIQREYYELIEEIKESYRRVLGNNLHSIYLYGSIPQGKVKKGLSDIDTLAIIGKDTVDSKVNKALSSDGTKLLKKYSLVSFVQMEAFPMTTVVNTYIFSHEAFILKSQGICVYGKDLIDSLPQARVSKRLANKELQQLKNDIDEAKRELTKTQKPEEVRYWCKRIMKNILRDGFYLVMDKERKYTPDIRLSAETFSKYYPDKKEEMDRVLNLANGPTTKKEKVLEVLDIFGIWIIGETDKWLHIHNPERKINI